MYKKGAKGPMRNRKTAQKIDQNRKTEIKALTEKALVVFISLSIFLIFRHLNLFTFRSSFCVFPREYRTHQDCLLSL